MTFNIFNIPPVSVLAGFTFSDRQMLNNKNMEAAATPGKQDEPWMKNLVSCLNRMKEEGYKEDFKVTAKGMTTFDKRKVYKPDQVRIVSFYRFEGESDPGDSMILYVIETDDGTKGTLADGYGAYADTNVSKFIVDVGEIQKVKVTDLHA